MKGSCKIQHRTNINTNVNFAASSHLAARNARTAEYTKNWAHFGIHRLVSASEITNKKLANPAVLWLESYQCHVISSAFLTPVVFKFMPQ